MGKHQFTRLSYCVDRWLMVSAMVVLLERLPQVPVMVTVEVPNAAVLATEKVTTVLSAVAAAKLAVTPEGKPEADNATVPSNPYRAKIAMADVRLAPGVMLTLPGIAARVKPGVVMVSAMVTLADTLPDVPVIVTVDVPAAAVFAVEKVTTLLPAVAVLKLAVTPVGKPVAASATVSLNP
jgi:hypothetical protein